MKVIRVREYGDADKLIYEDAPIPEPRRGEVRLKGEAIGVNFVDIYHRKGLYARALPFMPGSEFAGIVDAIGEGVIEFKPGDRVVSDTGSDGYAEYALAPVDTLIWLPDSVSTQQAAA